MLVASKLTMVPAISAAVASAATGKGGARVALVIGNASDPDSEALLEQPVDDFRAVADELKHHGFDVETILGAIRNRGGGIRIALLGDRRTRRADERTAR